MPGVLFSIYSHEMSDGFVLG
ncbi:hypothetical protein [Sicyoidochytrium minutum DNA virus]|nr:hypothetical protein [Sicyoidochytrium minutum DNA virus]